MNFTPGPWEYYEYDYSIGVKMPEGNKTRFDAFPYAALGGYAQEDRDIIRANAKLIAAAPDLLHSLKGMVSIYPLPHNEVVIKAIADIEKAEGRS